MKITLTEVRCIERQARKLRKCKRVNGVLEMENAHLYEVIDALKAEILEHVKHDATLSAKIVQTFATSEAVESKMRAGLPTPIP